MANKSASITLKDINDPAILQNKFARRLGLFSLFLACGLAVFVFASNYFSLFPTQNNTFRLILVCIFLAAALLCKNTARLKPYWPVFYALFIASFVFLANSLLAEYRYQLIASAGVDIETIRGKAVSKWLEMLVTAATVLGLTKLAGFSFASIYLRKGNLKIGLLAGGGLLLNYLTAALLVNGSQGIGLEQIGQSLAWGSIFAVANGFMEELWIRGQFLRKLQNVLGITGTIILTSIVFSMVHIGSVYLNPLAVPLFLINTFTLGFATAYVMYKTDSLLGPVLMHMAADIWLVMVIGI